jgi:hypothetical protein
MILVRDVFRLRFGKAKEARDLLERGVTALRDAGYPVDRVLADVTGEFYTLVMEARFDSLGDYERSLAEGGGQQDWQAIYRQLVPLVRSGHREVMREVIGT